MNINGQGENNDGNTFTSSRSTGSMYLGLRVFKVRPWIFWKKSASSSPKYGISGGENSADIQVGFIHGLDGLHSAQPEEVRTFA